MSYDMGEALKYQPVLTDHIQASAKMLQRSFKMFGDSIQIQVRPIQTDTIDNTNEREHALSYDGKRKRETDSSEACSSGIKKSHKETEDKSRPNKNDCPENIIINDNEIVISQNIDRITSEKNRGLVVLLRIQTDKFGDGLLFHRMTKSSTTTDFISLSQKYVDDFLRTTGIDLTNQKNTVNCDCTCVCLGP